MPLPLVRRGINTNRSACEFVPTATRLEALAIRLEAIVIGSEPIVIGSEPIATRLEPIATRLEAIAITFVKVCICAGHFPAVSTFTKFPQNPNEPDTFAAVGPSICSGRVWTPTKPFPLEKDPDSYGGQQRCSNPSTEQKE